jgi:hypothetical protein
MSAMADQDDNKDALLEKVDGLIRSGRARARRSPPPVLTDAIPSNSDTLIPTLTDAVAVPDVIPTEHSSEQPEEQPEQQSTPVWFDLDVPLEVEPLMPAGSEADTAAGMDTAAPEQPDAEIDDRRGGSEGVQPQAPATLQPAEPDAAPAVDKSAPEQPGTEIDDRPGEPDAPQPEAPATLQPPEPDDAQPQARANLQPEESHFAQPQAPESLQASISARLITAIEGEMAKLNREIPAHKSKLAVLQRSLSFALPELVRLRFQDEAFDDSSDDSDDAGDSF